MERYARNKSIKTKKHLGSVKNAELRKYIK